MMRLAAGEGQPLTVNPGGIDYEVRCCNFDFGASPLSYSCRMFYSIDFESYEDPCSQST